MIISKTITETTTLVEAVPEYSIELQGFWMELEPTWDSSNYFSFRYGNDMQDHFRKSTSGVAAINLHGMDIECRIPVEEELIGFISGGSKEVRVTVVYSLVKMK
jgi:hypothetical protein